MAASPSSKAECCMGQDEAACLSRDHCRIQRKAACASQSPPKRGRSERALQSRVIRIGCGRLNLCDREADRQSHILHSHYGNHSLRDGCPWSIGGLEPFDDVRVNWTTRYASASQLDKRGENVTSRGRAVGKDEASNEVH